eukprot:gene2260-2434_t
MEESKFDELLKKAFDRYMELEKDTFVTHSKKQGIEVSVKKSSEESDIIKGVGYTKMTPEEIYSKLSPLNSVKDIKYFNPKLAEREIIKDYGDSKIVFKERYSAGVMFVSDRDFVKASQFTKKNDKEYFWINAPVEDYEVTNGCVRALNKIAGWHFIVEDDQTKVIMIFQTVFNGYLPQYLIDQSLLEAPLCLRLMEK